MRLSTNNTKSRQVTRSPGHHYKFGVLVTGVLVTFFLTGMASRPLAEVRVRKLKNNAYQLLVKNKPYFIKGVCYSPVAIGQGNSEANFWSDPAQPWKVDGALMKAMGINTV